jgi:3-oxoacyl-[acyl-carrier protein] reductase
MLRRKNGLSSYDGQSGSYSRPEVGFGEIMNRFLPSPFLDSFLLADNTRSDLNLGSESDRRARAHNHASTAKVLASNCARRNSKRLRTRCAGFPRRPHNVIGNGEFMSKLSDKVAIVTGASKGIGAGIATAFAAEGVRVVVNYSSDRDGAERVAQEITDNGGEAITVGADVSKAAEVAQLFKEVDSAFGRLDVLVNNAGVFRFGAITEITEQSFHLHYDINVLGAILTVQEAIKRFGASGGSIINLSSIVGSHPVPGALLYASTKGAIETLTRGLALELASRKIRVNAIAPGHTETEGNVAAGTFDGGAGAVLAGKTPLGRLGRVSDIAPLAVFLASDESAWITGEVIRAAGGLVVAT